MTAAETTRCDLDLSSAVACVLEGRFLVDGEAPVGWFWTISGRRELHRQPFNPDGDLSLELERAGPWLAAAAAFAP